MTALFIVLFVVLVVLNLLDIYTTKVILDEGGRELNPLLNKMMSKIGVMPTLLLTKVVTLPAFFYVCTLIGVGSVLSIVLVGCLVALYTYIIRHNAKSLPK